MKYVFLLILCAFVFLVCFLVDLLLKKLFPKDKLEKSKQCVRLPRREAIFGVLLVFAAVVVLVRFLPQKMDVLLLIGAVVALLLGTLLLVSYCSFAIYYDEETFLYRNFRHKKTLYRYSQIRGQRSLQTRSGINTELFVGEESLQLYSAMQGLDAFLNKAFFRWCAVKGIDPDSIENNPPMLKRCFCRGCVLRSEAVFSAGVLRDIAHAQADALALFVHLQHHDLHHVADADGFRGMLDKLVADL